MRQRLTRPGRYSIAGLPFGMRAIVTVAMYLCLAASVGLSMERPRLVSFVALAAPNAPGNVVTWHLGLMDGDGEHRRIIGSGHGDLTYAWQPTGEAIAYTHGNPEVTIYYPRSGKSVVVHAGRPVKLIAWLPARQQLIFTWSRPGGTLKKQITGVSLLDLADGRTEDLLAGAESISSLAPAPDGKALALGSDTGIALLPLEATHAPAAPLKVTGHGEVSHLAWAPDGSKLAYARRRTPPDKLTTTSVHTYVIASGRSFTVQGESTGLHSVAWHPNSRRLAVAVREPRMDSGALQQRSQLSFADFDGTAWRSHEVATFTGSLHIGGWSPDGSAFLYSLREGSGSRVLTRPSRIYVARADGKRGRAISPKSAKDYVPEWQP